MKTELQKKLDAQQRKIDKLKFDLKYQTERGDEYKRKWELAESAKVDSKMALHEREGLNDELRAKIAELKKRNETYEALQKNYLVVIDSLSTKIKHISTALKAITDAYIK